jgi:hypothetical protein
LTDLARADLRQYGGRGGRKPAGAVEQEKGWTGRKKEKKRGAGGLDMGVLI